MNINLSKKPINPTIIVGFPGFGLVGTISIEFLINHLDCEIIGSFDHKGMFPVTPIHKGKLVNPMAVHYSKKYNLIILYTMFNIKGKEWEIANAINELSKQVKAKEIICIEGVNATSKIAPPKLLYYGSNKLENAGLKPVSEIVVIGVTGALLQLDKNINCVFAETHSALPDSKAAAKVIEVLDKYLGLKVDYKPLLKQALEFENKVKKILEQSSKSVDEADKKNLSYVG